MYYTKEQIKRLKELGAVNSFDTVLDSEYMRGVALEVTKEVADIYDAATGGKVSRTFGCKSCVFNLYRNAGELYRKSVEFQKKESMRIAREAKENKKNKINENGTGEES